MNSFASLLTSLVFFIIGIWVTGLLVVGWVLNLKHLLSIDNLSVFDAPFALVGVIVVPLGSIIGYFGW